MIKGKTADSYRQKPWGTADKPKKLQPEVVEGAKGYEPYPRHVKDAHGNTHLVHDHKREQEITGVKMNADGTPAVAQKHDDEGDAA